jgi:cytochrome c peroxidase
MITNMVSRFNLISQLTLACSVAFAHNSPAQNIAPIPMIEPAAAISNEAALGEKLFHSPKLSKGNQISCASCHNLAEGGDDGLPTSVGVDGRVGTINAPTVLNSSLNPYQFWDGRVDTLEDQVSEPIHNPLEMDSNWDDVIAKLAADQEFAALFNNTYQDGITSKNIITAIAAFERTLLTLDSPFDQYLKGDLTAIDASAQRGYNTFKAMGCASCHQGTNMGGNLFQYFGVVADYFEDRGNIQTSDYGRYNVTGNEDDRFKFKVPSLRNVARTAPYFHDGSATTLKQAITIMARYQLGRPLSVTQVSDIEAFLTSLNGDLPRKLQ